ncbi:hypothetical protein B0H14DRAFT_2987494, partial [Mycena olivaceomarginata]
MSSSRTLVVAIFVLGLWASNGWPLQITGPRSAQYHTNMTITWTSVSTDPPVLKILLTNSALNFIDELPTVSASDGNLTVDIFDVPTGEFSLTFLDEDNNLVAASVIDIVDAGSTASAGPSGSISGSGQASSRSTSITASSQTPNGSNQAPTEATRKHNGLIAGTVTGVTIASMLVLLVWWYARRRRATAVQEKCFNTTDESQFLAVPPIGAMLAPDPDEAWPSDGIEAAPTPEATPATPTPTAEPVVNNTKQPIILRWEPAAPDPPAESAASRQELEEEVRRLREHVSALSPPSYSAHGH